MRHGKKPTRAQKIRLKEKYGLRPENWLVVEDSHIRFKIVHKVSGSVRELV